MNQDKFNRATGCLLGVLIGCAAAVQTLPPSPYQQEKLLYSATS